MVWENILDSELKEAVNISESQISFAAGKSTIDANFILRQFQLKHTEKKKRLYHVFVDQDKAFDRVPRRALVYA